MTEINKKILLFCVFMAGFAFTANAQAEKKYIRHGNREYDRNLFSESEISYRKATDKNKESRDAWFNIGDALYKQKKYDEAGKQFLNSSDIIEDPEKKSASFYNLGNSLLMNSQIKESIEAYKESLRLNPDNNEAKFNLAYAQDLLQQQQQQQQQNNDEDKQDQNKDNSEQNGQNENNKNNNQQQNEQQAISKEDAERLLNALASDEKKVQEKVKLEKASREQVRTVKNW